MSDLDTLGTIVRDLPETGPLMPVLFVGHGSPMNGIELNAFSRKWQELGRAIPQPRAVICVSAHWLTRGTHITAMEKPPTIHDFGGFPEELYRVTYAAPGNPELAKETADLLREAHVGFDHDWGLDHGCWTVVRHMYPDANVPVLQLSIDYYQPPEYHYQLARELGALRRKGVLIIASGNMVHNLRMVAFDRINEPGYGYDWAHEMNRTFKRLISAQEHRMLIDYQSIGPAARLAIPTPDHYYPLLYSLGLQESGDSVEFFNDEAVGGSLTMTSVLISR